MRICKCFCHAVTAAKLLVYILVATTIFILVLRTWQSDISPSIKNDSMEKHLNIINNYYEQRKEWETSNLGTYLFKFDINNKRGIENRNKQHIFKVLVWKYWPWLELRHVYRFHNDNVYDPLHGCSVSNCKFSGEYNFTAADTVVVHLQTGLTPNIKRRNPSQLWIFWVDESPTNAFTLASKWPKLTQFSNIFNWSMTYRCPGHFRSDCNVASEYLFYVVAENSKCEQYITEKCFHHAYSKGAIPVIMGPRLEDCTELLPPDSFLHVDNFKNPEQLALEIIAISKNMTKLLSYHVWRNHFEVTNEHGYFGTKSSHLCRICEALNYNERTPKVYDIDALRWYLDTEQSCSTFK